MKKHRNSCNDIKRLLKNRNLGGGITIKRKHLARRSLNSFGISNYFSSLFQFNHSDIKRHDHQHSDIKRHDHQHSDIKRHDHQHLRAGLQDHIRLKLKSNTRSKQSQWGYLKFRNLGVTGNNESLESAIIFINNTNLQAIPGEENRVVYYEVKDAILTLDEDTSIIVPVAYNFDYVPKTHSFPLKKEWSTSAGEELNWEFES